MNLNLIETSLKELELLKERIIELSETELNEKTDTTYVKNYMRCMKSDIEDTIVHLKVFVELNR